jgi:hypothetical protein
VVEYSMELAVPGPNGTDHVSVQLYALDDGSMPIEQRKADGRAAMLARFPGAVDLTAGVSAAFKLFDTPVRWPQPHAGWVYNATGSTTAMPAAAALDAISAGAAGWDNAGGSGFHFDYLGETTTATGCNGNPSAYSKDGQNVVGWGHIIGGHLGFSCHWRGTSLVDATPYFEIQEIDIIFEPLFAYSAQSLQALALHEFGHALGLDHTEASLCPGRAMCGGVDAMLFNQPQADDIAGVIALYGTSPSPTATPPTIPPGERPYHAVAPAISRD